MKQKPKTWKSGERPPDAVFHWKGSRPTGAEGWVVIDRFINQLAGGGIFMHNAAALQEVIDIARNMSRKFTVTVPQIGGAKAGIRFNHRDPRATGVLRRFIIDNQYLLQNVWVTAGDLNTDDRLIEELIQQELGLASYQSALAKRLERLPGGKDRSQNLTELMNCVATPYFSLIGACVGHGVARTIQIVASQDRRQPKEKLRVAIQGFGVVGSSLAYYLQELDIAKVVAVADKYGYLHKPSGLDIKYLLEARERKVHQLRRELAPPEEVQDVAKNIFPSLTEEARQTNNATPRRAGATDCEFLYAFLQAEAADVFSPCAMRYQITEDVADFLLKSLWRDSRRCYLVGGSNNMFGCRGNNEELVEDTGNKIPAQLRKSKTIIVPDWVSNSGTAQLFHRGLTLDFDPRDPVVAEKILEATYQPIESFLKNAMEKANGEIINLFTACNELAEERLRNPILLAFSAGNQ